MKTQTPPPPHPTNCATLETTQLTSSRTTQGALHRTLAVRKWGEGGGVDKNNRRCQSSQSRWLAVEGSGMHVNLAQNKRGGGGGGDRRAGTRDLPAH